MPMSHIIANIPDLKFVPLSLWMYFFIKLVSVLHQGPPEHPFVQEYHASRLVPTVAALGLVLLWSSPQY